MLNITELTNNKFLYIKLYNILFITSKLFLISLSLILFLLHVLYFSSLYFFFYVMLLLL